MRTCGRYRATGAWADATIGSELRAVASRFPDRVAVVDADRRITHAELDGQATAIAGGLLAHGLRPGDAVIVQSGNVVETVVGLLGLLRAGLVPVCALPQHGERDIDALVAITGARAHLVQADWPRSDLPAAAARLRDARSSLRFTATVRGRVDGALCLEDLLHRPTGDRVPGVAAEDLAVLQLSGGTTGTPKLIPRLRCDYLCNARAWAGGWG